MPRTRYVERPGRTVADSLVTKDPWYRLQGGCSRQNCPVCYWIKGVGIRCTRENVGYRIECVLCEKAVEEKENEETDPIVPLSSPSRRERERDREKPICRRNLKKWERESKGAPLALLPQKRSLWR